MKKYHKFILMVCLFFMGFTRVYALSVSNGEIKLNPGKTTEVELYANSKSEITEVSFTLIYTADDVRANFIAADGVNEEATDSTRHTVNFDEAKSGKILLGTIKIEVSNEPSVDGGTVNIHTATAKDTEATEIELDSTSIKVTLVPEEPKEVDKNLLSAIESNIVKIDLEKDTFEYTVTIDDTVEALDLVPKTNGEGISVEVSNQKISELEDNKITITAKKGDLTVNYIINVKVKENSITVIDTREFKGNNNYKTKWIIMIGLIILAGIGSVLITRKKRIKKRRKKKVE